MARQTGHVADFFDYCPRCGCDIVPDDRVTRQGNGWIHVGCASGADDE